MEKNETVLNSKEVCERLGISPVTLRQWIWLKKCPFAYFKAGRKLRFPKSGVEAYIKQTWNDPQTPPSADKADEA